MKRIHGAVVGVLALTVASASFAAGAAGSSAGAGSSSAGSSASGAAAAADSSNIWQATQLTKMKVKNRQNEELGSISDLLIDKEGKVAEVVLREGGVAGMGGQQYRVPWDRVQFNPTQKTATIDVSKKALSSEFSAFEEKGSASQKKSMKQEQGKEGASGGSAGSANAPSGSSDSAPSTR